MAYSVGKIRLNGGQAASGGKRAPRVQPAVGQTAVGQTLIARREADPGLELQVLRSMNVRLVREVAALKHREAQMLELVDRDGLTGMFNRRRMMELLESAIADAAREHYSVGLLFIDLNGFKGINDGYGHAAGDEILTAVATRIAARVRAGDFVCRYGGDEFVVLLPQVPDEQAVVRVADTIRERIALPYPVRGIDQHLTAAIGVSMYPRDGHGAEELLQRADAAMYRLKARLARPMASLGTPPQRQPTRRRNDNSSAG